MPGAKLPAVRLPSSRDEEGGVPTPVVVDLPTSSKFGFAWPAEPPPPVQAPPSSERAVSLSSEEEEESEYSEAEHTSGLQSQTDHSEEDDSTPTANRPLKSERPITTDRVQKGPSLPRLSRAVSMPLPSRLGHLQNPRRPSHSSPPSNSSPPPISEVPQEYSQFHELSLELADSVQMMVQTLLQVSPSQVFDPAKEQFSACSLSVPTPCMSAIFTSMKNLNYISANMAAFCAEPDSSRTPGPSNRSFVPPNTPGGLPDDFDIGELLQSVGDTLSGAAAQAGVDLVLYHGDVGMKHVAVKGDECGISYALSHVVRQVICTAHRGDSIEIGLSVGVLPPESHPTEPDATPGPEGPPLAPTSPVLDPDGPLSCLFDISHHFASSDTFSPDGTSQDSQPSEPPSRLAPTFDTLILRRLLQQVGATLTCNLPPKTFAGGRACELAVTLERGSPAAVNARAILPPEYPLLSGACVAEEPSLEELAQFTETLRGKKVTLYASSKGSFAHHLTSYLTAWGLDVSHVSAECGLDGNVLQMDSSLGGTPSVTGQRTLRGSPLQSTPYGMGLETFSRAISHPTPLPTGGAEQQQAISNALSFIFIDDDIAVLRERLRKLRLQQDYPLTLSRKRPSLASHHRPRSSPHVQRTVGTGTPLPVVIVHFTSLANYKLVKDVIHSELALHPGSTSAIPEIMIIPKPAGPRRFLTALHTAVTKPLVDPFFTPIATTPITTGQTSFFNFNTPNTRTPSPKSPTTASRPSRTNSDRSTKSPKEIPGDSVALAPPSPLSMPDNMEYFSEAVAKLGASPSSGLVIQSPSGQPAGIFFHPKGKGKSSSVVMERERGQFLVPSDQIKTTTVRRTSNGKELKSPHSPHSPITFSSLHTASITQTSTPHVDIASQESQPASVVSSKSKGKKPSSPRTEDTPVPASPWRANSVSNNTTVTKVTTPPTSPLSEAANASAPRRNSRRPTAEAKQPNPQAGAKGPADTNIVVPPISVLIVDDNPINQTILSTFMKKKKIKYDVAKNGEEAVQKWRTGGFHLILMDIQMPVMDGIQATKEIRMMEKMNSSSEFPLSTPRSEGPVRTPPLRTPSEAPSSSTSSSSPYRSSVIIVALTASSLQSDRVAALAAGCNDFLTKPVSLQWLNNKIIEWGSIKALQMWADLRPEVVKSMSTGQAAQAHNVAQRLHVPEGRTTPTGSASRSLSRPRNNVSSDAPPPTSMEPFSPVIGGSAQTPYFSTKDDLSDSPSSDNPVSDSEPPRPTWSGADTAMMITDPPLNIPPSDVTDEPLNTDGDPPKQNDEQPSTSDQNPVIAFI